MALDKESFINSEFNKCFILKTKHYLICHIKTKMLMYRFSYKTIKKKTTYNGNICPKI